jgi:hypothetical protein
LAKAEKPYEPTPVDFEILLLVRAYHFLTVSQLIRLRRLSNNSLSTEQPRLKKLADTKYLDRRHLPHTSTGNTKYVYSLSTKGLNYLKETGLIDSSRYRRDILINVKYPHLDHALALNDFLIAARLLEKAVPYISLVEMRHDLDLKKTPVRVTVERRMPYGDRIDEKITVIPDGWLDFTMPVLDVRRCIVVELDRGTTSIAPFKEKLRAYYGYAISLEYQELFGTDLCMVAYATTAGKQRLFQMIEWCEKELQQQRLEHEANLYRFTSLPDGAYDPQEIFCTPVWYKPFEPEPVSLLWNV